MRREKGVYLYVKNDQNELNFMSKSSDSEVQDILDILDIGYGERSGYYADIKADRG
jgi:hypothetical protein